MGFGTAGAAFHMKPPKTSNLLIIYDGTEGCVNGKLRNSLFLFQGNRNEQQECGVFRIDTPGNSP
jgi:hypothetical protein